MLAVWLAVADARIQEFGVVSASAACDRGAFRARRVGVRVDSHTSPYPKVRPSKMAKRFDRRRDGVTPLQCLGSTGETRGKRRLDATGEADADPGDLGAAQPQGQTGIREQRFVAHGGAVGVGDLVRGRGARQGHPWGESPSGGDADPDGVVRVVIGLGARIKVRADTALLTPTAEPAHAGRLSSAWAWAQTTPAAARTMRAKIRPPVDSNRVRAASTAE